MNDHADYRDSSSDEELSLFDEKTLSDLEDNDTELETARLFPSSQWADAVKPHIRAMKTSSLRNIIGRATFALLPSFIQSRIYKDDNAKPERLYPTSYLDGMRGLAALFVFFCHYAYGSFVITKGYGFVQDGIKNDHLLQLPILRLLYSGPPMVCVFFVISGYALSLKPLKLMRTRSWDSLSTTMTSSIFRRGLRLFLPTTISTFMVLLLVRYGFYETNRSFAYDQSFFHNVREHHPEQLESFSAQFYDWTQKVFAFVHIWNWEPFGGSTPYDVHLWTIPVEFRCSMVLFLVLMGVARVRTWIRWFVLLMITYFTYRSDRWEMILFLAGTCLAELDLIRIARRNSSSSNAVSSPLPIANPILNEKTMTTPQGKAVKKYFLVLAGIVALYLMSQPDEDFAETPGWIYLSSLIPEWFSEKYRYWQGIGSILLVLATNFSPALQRPFNTSFVRYFGKISYAIYLIHGPVLHTVGYSIMKWAWGVTGVETQAQYVNGFVLGSLFVVPVVVWAADLFWRACDAPTVQFARWIEEKCDAGDRKDRA